MTDEERIHALEARVDDLSRSNKALWEWVRRLAAQGTMVLEIFGRLADRDPGWAARKAAYVGQIVDNSNLARAKGDQGE